MTRGLVGAPVGLRAARSRARLSSALMMTCRFTVWHHRDGTEWPHCRGVRDRAMTIQIVRRSTLASQDERFVSRRVPDGAPEEAQVGLIGYSALQELRWERSNVMTAVHGDDL